MKDAVDVNHFLLHRPRLPSLAVLTLPIPLQACRANAPIRPSASPGRPRLQGTRLGASKSAPSPLPPESVRSSPPKPKRPPVDTHPVRSHNAQVGLNHLINRIVGNHHPRYRTGAHLHLRLLGAPFPEVRCVMLQLVIRGALIKPPALGCRVGKCRKNPLRRRLRSLLQYYVLANCLWILPLTFSFIRELVKQ